MSVEPFTVPAPRIPPLTLRDWWASYSGEAYKSSTPEEYLAVKLHESAFFAGACAVLSMLAYYASENADDAEVALAREDWAREVAEFRRSFLDLSANMGGRPHADE